MDRTEQDVEIRLRPRGSTSGSPMGAGLRLASVTSEPDARVALHGLGCLQLDKCDTALFSASVRLSRSFGKMKKTTLQPCSS